MRRLVASVTSSLVLLCAIRAADPSVAPSPTGFPFQNPDLPVEERITDLIGRMTREEKIDCLAMRAAVPRLGVVGSPHIEGYHGVAQGGPSNWGHRNPTATTQFPQAYGLAATWNPELIQRVAAQEAQEARYLFQNENYRRAGLIVRAPNADLARDPRWGRTEECYGEDPFLAGTLAVAFTRGLQGDDPRYRKVDATAKHYAVHSGPEADRHHFDVHPSKRDLYETYLPAFQALVQEGQVASVMGAYNRVYGESASASTLLLDDILRERWGFKGYVVSDCDSIEDIFLHHKIVKTAEEAAALGVKRGCDLDCGKTYDALLPAVKQGLIEEPEIDVALRRLMYTRFKLGMFDPAEKVKWAQIPYSVNQAPEHDQLARRAAQSSIVLLKNTGVLPLPKDIGTLAVIGPTADDGSARCDRSADRPPGDPRARQPRRRAAVRPRRHRHRRPPRHGPTGRARPRRVGALARHRRVQLPDLRDDRARRSPARRR